MKMGQRIVESRFCKAPLTYYSFIKYIFTTDDSIVTGALYQEFLMLSDMFSIKFPLFYFSEKTFHLKCTVTLKWNTNFVFQCICSTFTLPTDMYFNFNTGVPLQRCTFTEMYQQSRSVITWESHTRESILLNNNPHIDDRKLDYSFFCSPRQYLRAVLNWCLPVIYPSCWGLQFESMVLCQCFDSRPLRTAAHAGYTRQFLRLFKIRWSLGSHPLPKGKQIQKSFKLCVDQTVKCARIKGMV